MGSKYLEEKTIEEIKKEISGFDNLNLKELSIEEIKEKIHDIILGHLRITYSINPEGLTRGRKNINNQIFTNKDELWYPNWDKIEKEKHQLNRCSDLGEKILYTSSETDTIICELQLEKGEFFTIVDFVPKSEKLNAIVQVIGINELSKSQEKFKKLFNEHFSKLKTDAPKEYEKNILIDNFLSTQFQIKVAPYESWKYKLTIAISQILLSNPETDGLLYPSISSNSKGANIVLKPEIVDKNLRIVRAGLFQVVDKTKEEGLTVRLIQVPAEQYVTELVNWTWRNPTEGDYQDFSVKCD
jgi:hypothetical protein